MCIVLFYGKIIEINLMDTLPALSLLLDKSRAMPDGTPCGPNGQVGDSSSMS